jgi:hypothetical protein
VNTLRRELEDRFPTLHLVGRNGMHKYNNQDHAVMTAMLCARNILAGRRLYDLWAVNQDAEYHEPSDSTREEAASGLRLVPARVATRRCIIRVSRCAKPRLSLSRERTNPPPAATASRSVDVFLPSRGG